MTISPRVIRGKVEKGCRDVNRIIPLGWTITETYLIPTVFSCRKNGNSELDLTAVLVISSD